MTDLPAAIAALRAERDANASIGHEPVSWFLVDAALAAIDAAQGEAVVEFMGRRRTPEKTSECWGVMLCDFMQDPPKGTKLYLAPQAPPAAVPPERDWTMIQCGDTSIPAWVVHYANAIGAYMKGQNVQHWAVGPIQSRNEAPPAAVPAEPVAWQYRFATPDGLTWSDWQQISSEAMAREMVEAFGKAGTRAEWRSLKVFDWGGYAGECTDADFADERAQQPAAAVPPLDASMPARIWLQIDTDGSESDRSNPFAGDLMDLTWHCEPIGGLEVEYVRADLAQQPAAAVPAANVTPMRQPRLDLARLVESINAAVYANGDGLSVTEAIGALELAKLELLKEQEQ